MRALVRSCPDLALRRINHADGDKEEQQHLEAGSVSRLEIGFGGPGQKRDDIVRHLRHGRGCAVGKCHRTITERRRHRDLVPGEVYVILHTRQIAMPPPLSNGAVTFADGTPSTVPQMAHDVVTFLTWAAEPNLEPRHRTGFKVLLFLLIAVGVIYAAKRKIWATAH